jgi:hypothetical protein
LAAEFQLPVATLREVFNIEALDLENPSRWPREIVLRRQLGSRFFPLSTRPRAIPRFERIW